MNSNISQYGWSRYKEIVKQDLDSANIARIQSVNKTNYKLLTQHGLLNGELTGQLIYTLSPHELPQTGDWVEVIIYDDQCMITKVLPRYSSLARKQPGKTSAKQMIATNIDHAIILQGLDRDFNPRRLERMITAIVDAGIHPIIVLNKVDLVDDSELYKQQVDSMHNNIECFCISALNATGIHAIFDMLKPEETYIIIGSSGAGKSTLINALMGDQIQATNTISDAVGKGQHTTTSRSMFVLPNGSIVIDTAGVREFGLTLTDTDNINKVFSDIETFGEQCRYEDCTHTNEPDCAVLQAIDNGDIATEVYASYLKLKTESEHYQTSEIDRKRKGKNLAKVIKNMKRTNMKKRY